MSMPLPLLQTQIDSAEKFIGVVAGVIVAAIAVGTIIYSVGGIHSTLRWLKDNAATKADIDALKVGLSGKQDTIKCQEQFMSCRAARQMIEMDLTSRVTRLEQPSGD